MNSFKGNISFFKGWLNFSSLKVLELLPAKARHNFFVNTSSCTLSSI